VLRLSQLHIQGMCRYLQFRHCLSPKKVSR
jgi:hypothetical protein